MNAKSASKPRATIPSRSQWFAVTVTHHIVRKKWAIPSARPLAVPVCQSAHAKRPAQATWIDGIAAS